MDFGEDFGLGEILLLLGVVGAIGYGIYYVLNNGIPGLPLGPGTPDSGGGAPSTGILSSLDNMLEIGQSSESMTDATQQLISNPLTSIGTIIGGWWDDLTGGGVSVTPSTDDGSIF